METFLCHAKVWPLYREKDGNSLKKSHEGLKSHLWNKKMKLEKKNLGTHLHLSFKQTKKKTGKPFKLSEEIHQADGRGLQ